MLVKLRRDFANIALPALQLGIVATAVGIDTRWGSVTGLILLMATGLYGWLRSIRHSRLIMDTPTSRIASAAQGYTELRGHGRPLDGSPLLSPVNALPVLWYRVVTQRKRRDGKWHHEGTEESDASFVLDDGSGQVAVDPEGAETLVRRRDVFDRGTLRHTQWSLIENDPLYVIGDFATLGSISPSFDTAAQIRDLLAEWKSNRSELLARFDLDGDGEIDIREWELARAQARREVARRRDEALSAPEAHIVRKPATRRLFLISDLDPAVIARRYRWWGIFHAAVFLAAAAATAWFQQIGAI
jgi:hypothetical protein